MLLPAVGESSPFMPCKVCFMSSLSMFGFHIVNKLHLGSSLHSPSVDNVQNSTNTVYKINNLGVLGANLSMCVNVK